jgi:hypothetical protein
VIVLKKKSNSALCALGIGLLLGTGVAAVMLAAVYLFILRGWHI